MAILYDATLVPTKGELLAEWLPGRAWWPGGAPEVIGAYRLDDPAGEVGLECFLVRAEQMVVHVPLAYRGSPIDSAQEHLVTTMEHSVLGRRWVYDGCADPVMLTELLRITLTGAHEAVQEVEADGVRTRRPSMVTAHGTGRVAMEWTSQHAGPPVVRERGPYAQAGFGGLRLDVFRHVGAGGGPYDGELLGGWGDGESGRLAGVGIVRR